MRVFGFGPKDSDKRISWINALNVTDYMGICEKHWSSTFPTVRVKGHDLPLIPPSVWSVPDSFCRQSPDRDVKKRCIDAEPRRSFKDATPDEIEVDPGRIESWKSLVNFCQGLEFSLTINEDSTP